MKYLEGMNLYDKGRYEQALHMLDEANNMHDSDDFEMLGSILLGLGTCHQMLRSNEVAHRLYQACIDTLVEGYGEDTPAIISPLVNIGILHYKANEITQAIAKYKRAQRISEGSYCTDRMICADLYHNLGVAYDSKNDLQKALQYYAKSLRVREKYQETAEQQLLLALTKENIAVVWRELDNHLQAIQLMKSIMPIRQKYNGVTSAEFSNSLFNLALLHFDVGRLNSAQSYFEKCLKIRETLLGKDSLQTKVCEKYLAALQNRGPLSPGPGQYSRMPENGSEGVSSIN
eukprot:TRINITY_DN34321_c0_g1_i1.p1 TRINITY_DN34321_c0_g1~~TRINITY_DN34321_c0_g1_i1.p1  ORF type:complete len:306 (+),score=37.92 TRINITY_DN34321_c0_g1_i1:57-920(+)